MKRKRKQKEKKQYYNIKAFNNCLIPDDCERELYEEGSSDDEMEYYHRFVNSKEEENIKHMRRSTNYFINSLGIQVQEHYITLSTVDLFTNIRIYDNRYEEKFPRLKKDTLVKSGYFDQIKQEFIFCFSSYDFYKAFNPKEDIVKVKM